MKSSDDGKYEFFRCRLKIVRDSAFQMGVESSFLFIFLHWLPVAARIKFKTLMLAYRTATGSAPSYFHSLMKIYIPSRTLRSASERHLVVPSQGDKERCDMGPFGFAEDQSCCCILNHL